ncbi:MAG: LytTR family DNA-binding domain-containing protein [Roseburia sp.]|nr:LytTR family DNA-binding domain-containing protein [Roseburia sp.]
MIRIGICDDVEEDLRRIEKIVRQTAKQSRFNIQVSCFHSGEELLRDIHDRGDMDIVFLDIYMKEMSGVETARCIREKDFLAILIFVSMYDQYCKELINVQPFAFIDKPVVREDLEQVLQHALDRKSGNRDVFRYSYKKVAYNVFIHKIRYFESRKREICIHSVDGYGMFYGKLDDLEKDLKERNASFIRVSQSFLVAALYIREIRYEKIVLDDGEEIGIGPKYRKMVKHHYMNFMKF